MRILKSHATETATKKQEQNSNIVKCIEDKFECLNRKKCQVTTANTTGNRCMSKAMN